MREIPLFVVNGFLESGKTTLIKEIIENNEMYHNGTTVIIVCEDGEISYDKKWCEDYGVYVEYIEDEAEFTADFMRNIDDIYHAEQYVIEYNSFFDWDNQQFKNNMIIYQQITLIDSTNFEVMFNNMRKIFQTMVKESAIIIFNRCDNNQNLSKYRRWIRGMNQQAQIGFEGSDGRVTATLDEDLPYDLSKDVIAFEDDVYPTWYIEVFDHYEKYLNKTFKFKAFVRDILEDTFVLGRKVMTCCADDIQFLGYEVINNTETTVKLNDCIYIECRVDYRYSNLAGENVVMLIADRISILKPEEEEVVSL